MVCNGVTDKGGPEDQRYSMYTSAQLFAGPLSNGGPEHSRMVGGKAAKDDRV